MKNLNNMNIINNMMGNMNLNNQNQTKINDINQMKKYLIAKYNITFRKNNDIQYNLTVFGRKHFKNLLDNYEEKMGNCWSLGFFYGEKNLKELSDKSTTVGEIFEKEFNPIVFLKDKYDLIGKPIKVSFVFNDVDNHQLIFNGKADVGNLGKNYEKEIGSGEYISLKFLYKGREINFHDERNTTIEKLFEKKEKNPKVYVNEE